MKFFLIMIGLLLIIMVGTNPSNQDYKDLIKKEISKSILNNQLVQNIDKIGGNTKGDLYLNNSLIRNNYIIFSICKLEKNTESGFVINDIIGKPEIIGNLEIAQKDFSNTMYIDDAEKSCTELGDGWRLPTKEELKILHDNRIKIGGFKWNGDYWWSNNQENRSVGRMHFFHGYIFEETYSNPHYVRAVRNLINNTIPTNSINVGYGIFGNIFWNKNLDTISNKVIELNNKIIGNPIQIGNLLVSEKQFPNEMIWEDAKKTCDELGGGWRLPTIEELNLISGYQYKIKLGQGFYWSSTEVDKLNAKIIRVQYPSYNANQGLIYEYINFSFGQFLKNRELLTRPVKSL